MKTWIWVKRLGIGVSLTLNLLFAVRWLVLRTSEPVDRLGRITRDFEVGDFSGDGPYFKLPKGLVVRDASPRGLDAIDLFEPHRFEIIVTTESENLVEYPLTLKANSGFGEFYSADWKSNHGTK